MKTKYILHGGSAQKQNSENDKFFIEILRNTSDVVNILLVHFAGRPEKAFLNEKIDKSQFERVKGNKVINYEIAQESTFLVQVKKADVIYFGGGTTVRLLDSLKQFANLQELFVDKIVAGESAGANCLSAYCYSQSGGGILKGMGLVPVKTIPHYQKGDEEKLKDCPEELETLLLSNYQFKVFEI